MSVVEHSHFAVRCARLLLLRRRGLEALLGETSTRSRRMLMRSADDFSSLRERNSVLVIEKVLLGEFWRECVERGGRGG